MTGKFAQANTRIGDDWRRLVELPGKWSKSVSQAGGLGDVAQGEAGGFFVETEYAPGRRAYLKPLKKHGWFRAAREKIAADLAHDLQVNVPPVLLTRNELSTAKERNVSVSLVMYPRQFSWGQLKHLLADEENDVAAAVSAQMSACAARALVFDTWLAQTDHDDHPSNIVFGYEGQDFRNGAFVFLDYAFSMGISGGWKEQGFLKVSAAPFPPRMCSSLDRPVLLDTLAAVERYPEVKVVDVVNRIPEAYLPEDEKDVVRCGLVARRALVREALRGYWGGTP